MHDAKPLILIKGFGLVTPLGIGAWPTFRNLLAGRRISDRAAGLPDDVASVDLVRSIGSVNAAQHTSDDPAIELAERAAREALEMAHQNDSNSVRDTINGEAAEINHEPMPCFIGTSKGAFKLFDEAAWRFAKLGAASLSGRTKHAQVVALGPHDYMSRALRDRLGLGVTSHSVAACASSLYALHHARQYLLHNADHVRRALVVTADASLTPLLIHAYEKLGVLAPREAATYRCNPLDENRQGFTLAEGAAAIVLEACPPDGVDSSPAPEKAIELKATAVGCDPFDLIRTSPDLLALARVRQQLLTSKTQGDANLTDIDLYHLHAPGTQDHDPKEHALSLADASPTDVYAHKGALGHTLGASGLMSVVLACLCQLTNRRPTMPWLESPIHPAIQKDRPNDAPPIRSQAILAAGFGGHAAGAVIGTRTC